MILYLSYIFGFLPLQYALVTLSLYTLEIQASIVAFCSGIISICSYLVGTFPHTSEPWSWCHYHDFYAYVTYVCPCVMVIWVFTMVISWYHDSLSRARAYNFHVVSSVQSLSCVRLFVTPWMPSMPDFPVHHQLPELAQTHVYWIDDAIQPFHPLLSPSPPAFNLSQHQGLFQWVSSLHQLAKVLEFQLQHQSFQWFSCYTQVALFIV